MSGVSCNSSTTRAVKETIAVRDRRELTEQAHDVRNDQLCGLRDVANPMEEMKEKL